MKMFYLIIINFIGLNAISQDTLNQIDDFGKKQGHWIFYGKDKPEKGYPLEGKIEEGVYKDDRKNGNWIKYHKDGITPSLKLQYVNNRPNGYYEKYYPTGILREKGRFVRGKQQGEFLSYHECGSIQTRKYYLENGREDGYVWYYYPSCSSKDSIDHLEMVYRKKDGVTVDTLFRFYFSGCVKEVVIYNNGRQASKTSYLDDCDMEVSEYGTKGYVSPNPIIDPIQPPIHKEPKKYQNGYNKIYNENDEIWMDGEFKGGKLWNGKIYKYSSDGLLAKIEIWKNGKYHSDGQFE
jgi:antitoxin component YwqK of YwqJK toxin-antitoxin module